MSNNQPAAPGVVMTEVPIDREVIRRLRPDARKRAVSTSQLANSLLAVIVEDGLVAAVLGDIEGAA